MPEHESVFTHRSFPPGVGNILVPMSDRRSARAALALYSPSRRSRILAQRGIWLLVGLIGPRAVPGSGTSPFLEAQRPDLVNAISLLEGRFGAWDATAVYVARDPTIETWSLLLIRGGEPFMWIRRRPIAEIEKSKREVAALRLIETSSPASFTAPRIVDELSTDASALTAMATVMTGLHHPADPLDLELLTGSISRSLEGLARPGSTPESWVPCHGDLTPWNLRQRRGGKLVIVDWEEVMWGPPGCDFVLFRSTSRVLGTSAGEPDDWKSPAFEESRRFWISEWARRLDDARRPALDDREGDELSRSEFASAVIRVLSEP